MSNKHNFKRGDRVRLKGGNSFVGIIVDVGFKSASIVWDCEPDEIYLQGYESIEHYDCRTAFLTRLQSLLREFDAHIEPCGCEIEGLSIVLKDNEEIYYKMDNFSPMSNLTAENIMDFDKE